MGMDIGAGFGAGGAVQGLQQLLAQRQMMRAYADQQQQLQTENAFKQQQLQQQDELKRAQIAEMASASKDRLAASQGAQSDRQVGLANALGDQLPAGTFLQPNDPAVGMLKTGGRGSLLQSQDERPKVDVGPLLPGDTGAERQQGFLKTASAKQQDTEADNARQAGIAAEGKARDAETSRHNKAMENRPGALITVNTVDDKGQPVTKVVPKTSGATFAKGPSAVTQNRLDSAQAVKQTGEDIISQLSDPKFQAVVGPALGRASTLRDFIGNPPPEYAQLAGQIESYALANMGVHGMRSAQGAQQISHLLDQHHTPESLVAAIKGLNGFSQHFLENSGRSGTASGAGSSKPSAADLIKKYGGQ